MILQNKDLITICIPSIIKKKLYYENNLNNRSNYIIKIYFVYVIF